MNEPHQALTRPLQQAFEDSDNQYASDKWSSYFENYEQVLAPFRDRPVRLLEIGVQNGGSLETWAKYFAHAESIIGVDIDPRCASLTFVDPRISVVIGNVGDAATEADVLRRAQKFNIIIDDGSHQSQDVVCAFARYFRHLSCGGVYIVEDLHTSYWHAYGGGLFHPFSSMALFKTLADLINMEHWWCALSAADVLAEIGSSHGCSFEGFPVDGIHEVTFLNSLCAVKRAPVPMNRLGTRTIREGAQDVVRLNPAEVYHSDQTSNEWSQISSPAAIVHRLTSERERLSVERDQAIAERDQAADNLANVTQSLSWRATKPLRHIRKWMSFLRSSTD